MKSTFCPLVTAIVCLAGILPSASGQTRIELRNSDSGGAISLNGEAVSLENLSDRLKKAHDPRRPLELAAEPAISADLVKSVVNAASGSGISRLTFSTLSEAPKNRPAEASSELERKLAAIVIPSVEFVETPMEDAVAFLRVRARDLDESTGGTDEKGVNIVLDGTLKDTSITLKLRNVPVGEALKYVAALGGAAYSVEGSVVVIGAKGSGSAGAGATIGSADNFKIAVQREKLAGIKIPRIEFVDTPLKDALAFLQSRSTELDMTTTNPLEKGIDLIVTEFAGFEDARVSLNLSNISLGEALKFTCSLAGGSYEVEPNAVVIRGAPNP